MRPRPPLTTLAWPTPGRYIGCLNGVRTPAIMWKSWANLLTASRLIAIPPSIWAILDGHWGIAGALFTLAVITDFADGPIARSRGEATPLGGLFDHATDATFVSGNLAALAFLGMINPWLPGLVALAFIQYMLDSRALAGAVLKTSLIGRYNGIAYFVMLGIPVMREALGLTWPVDSWIGILAWILVITTAISMLDRALALLRGR